MIEDDKPMARDEWARRYANQVALHDHAEAQTSSVAADDPMDWPLPCDVTVGHGTIRKGVSLRTLVARMKGLYKMATGEDSDLVANRTPVERATLAAEFQRTISSAPTATAKDHPTEVLVRFCPGCGSVGDVDQKYRDCCPDGSKARMIPAPLAENCRDLFELAISAAKHQ